MRSILPDLEALLKRTKESLEKLARHADSGEASYESRDRSDVEWGDLNAEFKAFLGAREEISVLTQRGLREARKPSCLAPLRA